MNNSDDPRITAILKRSDTCVDGERWIVGSRAAGLTSAQEVWDGCPRGDWLIWAAAVSGVMKFDLVNAALACINALPEKQPDALQPFDIGIVEAVETYWRYYTMNDGRFGRTIVLDALARVGSDKPGSAAALAVYQLARLVLSDHRQAVLAVRAAASVRFTALALAGSHDSEIEQHQLCADLVREHISLPTGTT